MEHIHREPEAVVMMRESDLALFAEAMAQCGQPCKSKTPTGNSKSNSLPTGAASTPDANTSAICAA